MFSLPGRSFHQRVMLISSVPMTLDEVLKSAKVRKQNITRQERTALKGLQKEKSITILPADKGKATDIMETREYQEKMKEMLNDEATYEKLKKDPTKKYKADIIRMVNSVCLFSKIVQWQLITKRLFFVIQ